MLYKYRSIFVKLILGKKAECNCYVEAVFYYNQKLHLCYLFLSLSYNKLFFYKNKNASNLQHMFYLKKINVSLNVDFYTKSL